MDMKRGQVRILSLLLVSIFAFSACRKETKELMQMDIVQIDTNQTDTVQTEAIQTGNVQTEAIQTGNVQTETEPIESYSAALTSTTVTKESQYHLFGMEELNLSKDSLFKDFELNEVWIEGAPYYQFVNKQYDVRILIDETENNATLHHSGQSIKIEFKYGITMKSAATYSSIGLMDLTGDDCIDLVLWGQTGGTGGAEQYIRVYDLEKMREIKIEDYLPILHSFLEIIPIDTEETDKSTFRIKTGNGEEYVRSINVVLLEPKAYEFTEDCLMAHNIFSIDEQSRIINIEHGVTVSGAMQRDYLGKIKGTLAYSEERGLFELIEGCYFQ